VKIVKIVLVIVFGARIGRCADAAGFNHATTTTWL